MAVSKHDAPRPQDIAGSPYRVPPEPNRWPSIFLAVGVHALLLAFLWIGVSWQNNTPVAVEAEIWDVTTQTAAPPPPPPQPEPEPEPEPETPPQPEPAPRAVEPPPAVERPVEPKQPDIALEREKKRKEELKKRQEEERLERERELAEKREQEKKEKALAEKRERDELEKKLKEEQKRKELAKKEEAEKKKAEKEKAEKLAKAKAEKVEKEKAEKAENAKLAKLRDAEMKRLMAGAGNPGSTGSAEKSTAPRIDKGYTAAITAKVKGNTSYAGDTDEPGNPTATFIVQQLPTGEIISVKKTKSSGIPAFDDAVEKGIVKSSPLPKKKDGTVEKTLEINFRMKDLQ